jgi:CHAT domain-containing protein
VFRDSFRRSGLFLYPDKAHHGQYRAFETLQNPVGGLDLVSLSACETALGRIDANENPPGLQAFLFTAGEATILSCLWPLRDSVAAFFFQSFYGKLAHQESRLEAFAEAQRCTRES